MFLDLERLRQTSAHVCVAVHYRLDDMDTALIAVACFLTKQLKDFITDVQMFSSL